MYIPTSSERRKPSSSSAFSIDSIISSKTSAPSQHHPPPPHHQQQQPQRHHPSETHTTHKVRGESEILNSIPGDLFPSSVIPPSPPDLLPLHRLPPASSFIQHRSSPLHPYTGLRSFQEENALQRNTPTYFSSSRIPFSMETFSDNVSMGHNLADPFYAWLAASATGPHQFQATDIDMFYTSSSCRKSKRIRTAFSPSQLVQLEEAFDKNRYIVGHDRKRIAADLQLTETQVKVWFQNRRTKTRRSDSTTTTTTTSSPTTTKPTTTNNTTTTTSSTSDHHNQERGENSTDKQQQSNNIHRRRHHHNDDRQTMTSPSSSSSSVDDCIAVDLSDDDNSTECHGAKRNSSPVRQTS